jgi:hypothetical protein
MVFLSLPKSVKLKTAHTFSQTPFHVALAMLFRQDLCLVVLNEL